MKTKKQKEILDKMNEVNSTLADILREIKEENKISQFDYCTDPQLSDFASSIEQRAAMIHGIVYQNV